MHASAQRKTSPAMLLPQLPCQWVILPEFPTLCSLAAVILHILM